MNFLLGNVSEDSIFHGNIDQAIIGNHMISSAIWDKSARANFSKANEIAVARRASAICSL